MVNASAAGKFLTLGVWLNRITRVFPDDQGLQLRGIDMVSIDWRARRRGKTNFLREPMLLVYGLVTGVLFVAVVIRLVSF